MPLRFFVIRTVALARAGVGKRLPQATSVSFSPAQRRTLLTAARNGALLLSRCALGVRVAQPYAPNHAPKAHRVEDGGERPVRLLDLLCARAATDAEERIEIVGHGRAQPSARRRPSRSLTTSTVASACG